MIQPDPGMSGSSEEQSQAYGNTSETTSAAELEMCRAKLSEVQREADEFRDRYLRASAEVQNAHKQAERNAAALVLQGRRRLLRDFLDVADSLEMALSIPADSPGLYEGVKLAYRQLEQALVRAGAERMVVKPGDTFDPVYHEAVEVRIGEAPQDTVLDVVRSGYLHEGSVLRPAQVIVARGRQ